MRSVSVRWRDCFPPPATPPPSPSTLKFYMKPFLAFLALITCMGTGWMVYLSSLKSIDAASAAESSATAAPFVRIEKVRIDEVDDRIELVGSLEPLNTVEIRAATTGYVRELPVDLGDFVEAGAVIAKLEDATAREVVNSSEAALRVAEARLKAQEATAAHAKSELSRWERLAKTGVSTGQQLDAARAEVAVAVSQVELERAQVEQAKAQLDQARLEQAQTIVHAPAAGYVAQRLVSVGHLATPDLPLLRLVSIATVRTIVHVPEQDYARIQEGQDASLRVDALPERTFQGRVIRKAPVLDPLTRTAAVEIEIPNDQIALKPGMHARVAITFETRQATVVPTAALRDGDTGQAVYVVSGDPPTARRVEVAPGVFDEGQIEILHGLESGDWVVTLGHDSLGSGGEVQPIHEQAESPLLAGDSDRRTRSGNVSP